MKKLVLLVIAMLVACSAQARAPFRPSEPRSGLYVGLKSGGTLAKIKTPWVESGKKKDDSDGSFNMAASIGVRVRYFRLEAEYMMMNKQKVGSYEQDVDTMMAQLYFDLPFKSPIKPFFNVGAGLYSVDFKRKGYWSDSDRVFTWGGGGGLTWNISTATSLDLGYRYLSLDDLKTEDGSIRQDNHVLYLGWRHVF